MSGGLPEEVELFGLSFLGGFRLGASSGLVLTVFDDLAADAEAEEDSFLLAAAVSAVFFFTLSLFAFTLSVFTFAFGVFSLLVLSTGALADLAAGLGTLVLFTAGTLEAEALPGGLEDTGGVLLCEGISSIGSSLTGVASPRSMACCDGSASSAFFRLTFLVFRTLELDFVPVEDEDGGG